MKERVCVGFDLRDDYSQVCAGPIGSEPVILSSAMSPTSTDIEDVDHFFPTMLARRPGSSTWYSGWEAKRRSDAGEAEPVDHLLSLARDGAKVRVAGDWYDPVALLALFAKRSLSMMTPICDPERAAAMTFTVEVLDGATAVILEHVIASIGLRSPKIYMEDYAESFYHYLIMQSQELWRHDILLCNYAGKHIDLYLYNFSRNTKPSAALVKHLEFAFPEQDDGKLLEILRGACQGRSLSSSYLIGEGFASNWMRGSVRYLGNVGKVFSGSTMYSKGAFASASQRIEPTEASKTHVYLGSGKVTSNVGLVMGDEWLPLINAGDNWFEASRDMELYLADNEDIVANVTPMDGKVPYTVRVSTDGMPPRPGGASRVQLHASMMNAKRAVIQVRDLGFGEIYPSTDTIWDEEFDL